MSGGSFPNELGYGFCNSVGGSIDSSIGPQACFGNGNMNGTIEECTMGCDISVSNPIEVELNFGNWSANTRLKLQTSNMYKANLVNYAYGNWSSFLCPVDSQPCLSASYVGFNTQAHYSTPCTSDFIGGLKPTDFCLDDFQTCFF